MTTSEITYFQDIMDTMEQAYIYLHSATNLTIETQLEVAETVCETVSTLNHFLGNDTDLHAKYNLMVKTKLFTIEEERLVFLQHLTDWIQVVDAHCNRNSELFFSMDPFEKDERMVLNRVDNDFYSLMDDIGTKTKDKTFYHILNLFEKLPENSKKDFDSYTTQFQFWGSLHYTQKDYTLLENRAAALANNRKRFLWLYEHLEDYRSKMTLYAILNNWYNFDFETLRQVKESCYKDYFDLDIFHCDENEVMVDLGAYTGDTIQNYVSAYGIRYKRIYCYEITPATIDVLKNNSKNLPNIIYRPKGASDKAGILYIDCNDHSSANILSSSGTMPVETVALDEDITEPVTLIKMDIEGSEQAALRGSKNHIKNEHPKLAISVYHNNEDIWKIAHMIYEMDNTYRFFLRHNGENLIPTEYVLLAI